MKVFCGLIAAIGLMLGFVPASLRAQAKAGTPERELFDDTNRERSARGVALLRWDAELAAAARLHAQRMAQQNDLSHQFAGEPELSMRLRQAGAHFSAAAENVAEGPTPALIHDGWMKSPGHRENILDPALNSLGIAVVERNGQLFAVQDFSKSLAELSLADEEQQVAGQLKSQGLHIQADATSARSACESGHADTAGHRSVFVLRYSATDLSKLPDSLAQAIHSGRYSEAAVGACATSRDANFSTYNLAVLLYEQ
jgi:hypothetical protein